MRLNRHCERSEAIQKTKIWISSSLSLLTTLLFLSACAGYKTPSLSGDPSSLSTDTLCFRYESSKDPALAAEIDARNLDCAGLLREDSLYTGPDDAAYQMTR